MSLQICYCGWTKVTTYHGLRTHQGKMGCTPKGMSIPESERFSFLPQHSFQGPRIEIEDPSMYTFTSPSTLVSQQNIWRESPQKNSGLFTRTTPVRTESFPAYPTRTTLPSTEDAVIQTINSMMGTHSFDTTHAALDFGSGAQIFSNENYPLATDVAEEEANKSAFQTPPLFGTALQTSGNARRALDFSTGAQQVGQPVWHLPTNTAQETVKLKERETETERKKEKEREALQLQRARQDRVRAELQQKIQTREQKMAEVRSSVKTCKVGLDDEWRQINSVFTQVVRIVEAARQKALQPVEERTNRVKREAEYLEQELQKEIDKFKMTIDELNRTPDLQVSPQTCDWKDITLDTSVYFGTLRTTTSIMMEKIQQELEKLSSVELKRIPTFAVDVKLDATTAHPCLVLSPDGKSVRDGGAHLKVPDAPQRFDVFGSILGLNGLTSGKSYWEVEVRHKSGWDLGVASRAAPRKGRLSLSPDSGYWATVHYEGGKYAALTEPRVSLHLPQKPQKVGVFVDYEEGLVSFYDVEAKSHIYSFTGCSFSGGIFPYFSPHLKQNKNSHPLIISAVEVHV